MLGLIRNQKLDFQLKFDSSPAIEVFAKTRNLLYVASHLPRFIINLLK